MNFSLPCVQQARIFSFLMLTYVKSWILINGGYTDISRLVCFKLLWFFSLFSAILFWDFRWGDLKIDSIQISELWPGRELPWESSSPLKTLYEWGINSVRLMYREFRVTLLYLRINCSILTNGSPYCQTCLRNTRPCFDLHCNCLPTWGYGFTLYHNCDYINASVM